MNAFVDLLKKFDRKERNWLIRDMLGNPPLSEKFRERLEHAISEHRPNFSIPSTAWWAIDYHWDWIFGAVKQLHSDKMPFENRNSVAGHQEDVDLIVAFDENVILLEAKATGSWSNSQASSKLGRYERLQNFAQETGAQKLQFFFLLASPKAPINLPDDSRWGTSSGRSAWMRLSIPIVEYEYLAVTRCHIDGATAKDGGYWKVSAFPSKPSDSCS